MTKAEAIEYAQTARDVATNAAAIALRDRDRAAAAMARFEISLSREDEAARWEAERTAMRSAYEAGLAAKEAVRAARAAREEAAP